MQCVCLTYGCDFIDLVSHFQSGCFLTLVHNKTKLKGEELLYYSVLGGEKE